MGNCCLPPNADGSVRQRKDVCATCNVRLCAASKFPNPGPCPFTDGVPVAQEPDATAPEHNDEIQHQPSNRYNQNPYSEWFNVRVEAPGHNKRNPNIWTITTTDYGKGNEYYFVKEFVPSQMVWRKKTM